MTRKERAAALSIELPRIYPDAHCELDYSSPLELLVATILSAQCTDVRVNIVTRSLFARCRSATDYAPAGGIGNDRSLRRILPQQGQINQGHG